MIKFNIVSFFPKLFHEYFKCGVIGRYFQKNTENINLIPFKLPKERIDDTPFGGGPGMLIKANIVDKIIEDNKLKNIIFLSPVGEVFNANICKELSELKEISIICGRYEGIDRRVIDYHNIREISVGDYILSCGEPAAIIIVDSVIRLIKGTLNNEESNIQESFNFFLEHDQYTQPRVWNNMQVPNVLLSGNHKEINEWKFNNSLERTIKNRPDLFKKFYITFIQFLFYILK